MLASAGCKANIARAKELMAAPMPAVDPPAADDTADQAANAATDNRPPCPCCGGRMIIVEFFKPGSKPRGPPSSQAAVRPQCHDRLDHFLASTPRRSTSLPA